MNTQIKFIDREAELTLIDQAIRAKNTRRIIGIQADGGVGKTRLLQEIQHIYNGNDGEHKLNLLVTDILDFDDRANHIPQNVGRRIAQMLGANFFKPYLRGLHNYRMLERAGTRYARLQEARRLNQQTFIECFNQATHRQRAVLLLDTTEKLSTETEYLRNWIEQTANVVWILVGRVNSELIQWARAKHNSREIFFRELEDLLPKDSRAYLHAKQQSLYFTIEPNIAEKLLVLAQGRPILIDLAVEWLARDIPLSWLVETDVTKMASLSDAEKAKRRQTFEQQLVLSIADMRRPMDRLTLALAYVYPLDVAILGKLLSLSQTQAQSLFQEARQYVSIKILPDGRLALHDEMRRMVRAYVWPDIDPDDERRREYSEIAVGYFKKLEKSLKDEIDQLEMAQEQSVSLTSQEEEELDLMNALQRQTLERELWVVQESLLQHTLFIDLAQGIDLFARLFDEATRAYTFERREIFYTQMQAYNFDEVSPTHKYEFYSRKVRYFNDTGQFEEAQALATTMLSGELESHQRLDFLTLSGRSYELSHNLLKALEQYEKAWEMCECHPDLAAWKGTVLKNLGRVTREMRRTEDAIAYYKQALFIAEDPAQIASILNSIGYVWSLQGRYRGGYEYCRKALLIYKALKRERDIGTTLATIGEVYRSQNHYDQAIDYYTQAEPYFKRANDMIWLARLYGRRGAVHRLQKNYGLAIRDLEASLNCNIKEEQPWTYHVLGCVFWNQQDWDLAEEKFRQSDMLAREVGDVRSQVNNLVGYAELYFDRWAASNLRENGYPAKIREKARQLEALLQQGYGFPHHEGRMKRALADVYYYEENYGFAFKNYKVAFTLLGSRLGGYARLTNFESEVEWLSARIMELATLGQSDLAMAWCQNFRKHWENAALRMMQRDLLLSMCDICEMDIKLRDKGIL